MEIKILQVFLGADGLPYKDQERTVHFPIVGSGFQGASNTTQIRFYYDELAEQDDTETAWVACAKLPNGKIGSKVLETDYDSTLGEHYALLELDSFYFQYKGDVYISLQGYQGGVQVDYDEENELYTIYGTPTIAATGSIKLSVNYATQFVGSGETSNVNFQRILADLGTKLGIRATSVFVEELPTVGNPETFYVIHNDTSNPNKANIYIWNSVTEHYICVGDNSLDLGNYYTKEQGNDFEEEIENRVESVENELSSVASGSPKGVYATLAALQAAYPTGTTGIYLVTENGHWYYWNGTAWADGGVYQAARDLDYEDMYKRVEKEITNDVTLVAGQFRLASNGNIVGDSPSYSMVMKMPLYPSQTVKLYCYAFTTVGVIVRVDSNGNYVETLVTSNNTQTTYEYTNESTDLIYVDLSFTTTNDYNIYLTVCAYKTPALLYNAAEQCKNEINNALNTNLSGIAIVTGTRWIYNVNTGVLSSDIDAPTYALTKPIVLYPGTTLTVYGYGYAGTNEKTSIISLVDDSGKPIECKVYTSGSSIATYTYKNETNSTQKVAVCYSTSIGATISTLADSLKGVFVERQEIDGIVKDATDKSIANQTNIVIKKVSSTQFSIYVPSLTTEKKLRYDFEKCYKKWASLTYKDSSNQTQTATNVVSSNFWNNYYVYDEDNNYIAQGNSNFIAKEIDGLSHIGDGHGNEVILYFALLADGVDVDIENMSNGDTVICSDVRLIERSNVYRCGGDTGGNEYTTTYPELDVNGNPVVLFQHNMEISYNFGNRTEMKNQIVFKQNGVSFRELYGAMLQCMYGDFTTVVCNNSEGTRNLVSSEGVVTVPDDSTINLTINPNYYQKADRVEMFGGNFYIRQDMIQDDPSRHDKSSVHFWKYDNRLKCYFQPAIVQQKQSSWGDNEVFNSGEQISVTCNRIISVKKSGE